MLAPLCIREHIDNKDRYITIEDADFAQQFTRVIAYQLKDHTEFTEKEKNSVQLIPYEDEKNSRPPLRTENCLFLGRRRIDRFAACAALSISERHGFQTLCPDLGCLILLLYRKEDDNSGANRTVK